MKRRLFLALSGAALATPFLPALPRTPSPVQANGLFRVVLQSESDDLVMLAIQTRATLHGAFQNAGMFIEANRKTGTSKIIYSGDKFVWA